MSFGLLLASFRRDMAASPRGYCTETIDSRMAIVRRYLAAVPAWKRATPFDVEDFVGSQGWGPSTLRDAVSHIRQFYRWAIRHGHTTTDPTATVELPRAPRRLPRPARDVAISAAVHAADPMMTAILALMCGAGLRCCEVSALRWSDVDMIAGTVHVTGKFDRERVLEISPDVRRALAAIDAPGAHIFRSPRDGAPLLTHPDQSARGRTPPVGASRVFGSPATTPFRYRGTRRV